MLLHVVAELLLFLAVLDQFLTPQVCIADGGPVGTHGSQASLRCSLHDSRIAEALCRCGITLAAYCQVFIARTLHELSISRRICCIVHWIPLLLLHRFDFKLEARSLLMDVVHARRLNSRLDVVALVGLVVHWVLGQIVDTGAHLAHQEIKLTLRSSTSFICSRVTCPLIKGITNAAE